MVVLHLKLAGSCDRSASSVIGQIKNLFREFENLFREFENLFREFSEPAFKFHLCNW